MSTPTKVATNANISASVATENEKDKKGDDLSTPMVRRGLNVLRRRLNTLLTEDTSRHHTQLWYTEAVIDNMTVPQFCHMFIKCGHSRRK